MVQGGDMKAEALRGSWAGASGNTQFMPSTFQRAAVDFDGDGRRDLIESVPDALGSVANYLKRAGWMPAQPWGFEVRLPENYGGAPGPPQPRTLPQKGRPGLQPPGAAAPPRERRPRPPLPAGRPRPP